MSTPGAPKHALMNVIRKVTPAGADALAAIPAQQRELHELRERLERAERDIRELRDTVATLNRDLDESRRLNLRAAELMDVAFTQLSR
jgi:uncharacterized tellurite resistance protein B-like protein